MPVSGSGAAFEYYVIPAAEMARHVSHQHQSWLDTPGKHGREHRDSRVRIVGVTGKTVPFCWDITPYRDRWDLISAQLGE
jgi:hypothetical protein